MISIKQSGLVCRTGGDNKVACGVPHNSPWPRNTKDGTVCNQDVITFVCIWYAIFASLHFVLGLIILTLIRSRSSGTSRFLTLRLFLRCPLFQLSESALTTQVRLLGIRQTVFWAKAFGLGWIKPWIEQQCLIEKDTRSQMKRASCGCLRKWYQSKEKQRGPASATLGSWFPSWPLYL